MSVLSSRMSDDQRSLCVLSWRHNRNRRGRGVIEPSIVNDRHSQAKAEFMHERIKIL